jgi:acetyltransferase-like isoleucine patch superfamily enzyme
VRICRYAWIGEGAVIGADNVVISDIPPYSLAIGNPAEAYSRDYGRPSGKAADSSGSGP